MEQAFQKLKQILTHPQALIFQHADCQPFVLDADACATGVGALLSQYVDTEITVQRASGGRYKEHVVAYASRALSSQRRRDGNTVLCDMARDACSGSAIH